MRALGFIIAAAAAATASAASGPGWRSEFLTAHNAIRVKLGSPPLRWSPALELHAREWADTLLREGRLSHRGNPRFGENLFDIEGGAATPRLVVNSWASEARQFDHARARCTGRCGHYTQILWRGTREVGCAVARSRSREVWVCNYNPPGNIAGESPLRPPD